MIKKTPLLTHETTKNIFWTHPIGSLGDNAVSFHISLDNYEIEVPLDLKNITSKKQIVAEIFKYWIKYRDEIK